MGGIVHKESPGKLINAYYITIGDLINKSIKKHYVVWRIPRFIYSTHMLRVHSLWYLRCLMSHQKSCETIFGGGGAQQKSGDLLVHNFVYDVGNSYTNIKDHQGYPGTRTREPRAYIYISANSRATKRFPSLLYVAGKENHRKQNRITFDGITLEMVCHFFWFPSGPRPLCVDPRKMSHLLSGCTTSTERAGGFATKPHRPIKLFPPEILSH